MSTQPPKNQDLHGSAPENAPVALLLIDVINDMEFEGGEELLKHALPMAERIAALKRRCRDAGIPAIYVNDNFGRWQSDWSKLVDRCMNENVRGKPVVELLRPEPDDYFVLKPKHSGFFGTTLGTLVEHLGARTLVFTGIAGNSCVLASAFDAHMRDLFVVVPPDCVASGDPEMNREALRLMERTLQADTTPSDGLDLKELKQRGEGEW